MLALIVKDEISIGGQRVAIGHGRDIFRNDLVPDAPDRRFRRPAERYQPQIGLQPAKLFDNHGLDVIAALRHEPERRKLVATAAGEKHFEDGRHRAPERDAMFGHQLIPAHRILFLSRFRQHQRRPGDKRAENIEDGHVVMQRRD